MTGATSTADVIVVGAGIVGAACAYALARESLEVCVVERGSPAGATTAACEGNVLMSDKLPGPELALALWSARRWPELDDELDVGFELERKGGLVAVQSHDDLERLRALAAGQSAAGVGVEEVDRPALHALEPHASPDLVGGMLYAGDMQLQPMLAAAALLRGAQRSGARLRARTEVERLVVRDDRVVGVRTAQGEIHAGAVVLATGPWCKELAEQVGTSLPVHPRRGVVLVTEPLPPIVRHKVYAAGYVGDVGSDDPALQVSAVVEGTRSGTVLIGASRERVGVATQVPTNVLARLAAAARALFPILDAARVIRWYAGFRPFCSDHLPVIGPDPAVTGLWHATGHEGSGIGLAPGTGELIAAGVAGRRAELDGRPFLPSRFPPGQASSAAVT